MSELQHAATKPQEHHLPTLRTGRYYTLGAAPGEARQVWIVLHGYAQLAARQLRHFENIVPADTLIVAPEALSRFYLELPRADGGHMARAGAAWMTREDREAEIDDASGWLDRVYREVTDSVVAESGKLPAVTVLAFSQGVATSMRWIARGSVKLSRVIMWAGSIATDVDRSGIHAQLSGVDVVLVTGTHDQFLRNGNRERVLEQWNGLGLPFREISYDGTHELNAAVIAELLANRP